MFERCSYLANTIVNSEASGVNNVGSIAEMSKAMVGQPGFEPGTSVLSGLRSNHLSYWPYIMDSDTRAEDGLIHWATHHFV